MKKPNWQSEFRGLPTIPVEKRYGQGESRWTKEKEITLKLFRNVTITKEEHQIILELITYYKDLDRALKEFDFSSLKITELRDFKGYLQLAFSYQMFLVNPYTIFRLYRVVINEKITGSKKTLTKKRQLSYPPLHIVRAKNIYNRANTSRVTLFYGSQSIDTALSELKPDIGDTVTIGEWVPKGNNKFNCFTISHSYNAFGKNEDSSEALIEFKRQFKNLNPLFTKFAESYFNILGYEYSKDIKHHFDYMISALFSEQIFSHKPTRIEDLAYKVDCIIYPSVGNRFITSNMAVKREVLNAKFELASAIELEVTETNYNEVKDLAPDSINVVNYKNLKKSKKVENNTIIW